MRQFYRLINKNGIQNNVWKFYLSAFFGSWSFAIGILVFHYRELGFTFSQIFLLAIVYELFNFFLEIPTGLLADLWSCKKVIILGCLISGLSFFIVLIKPELFITYLIWSVLSAICTTLNSGSYDAYIYDTMNEINPDNYPKVLGRISAISFITQAITIFGGGIVSEIFGFNFALILSGIGGLLQAFILSKTTEPILILEEKKSFIVQSIFQQLKGKITSSFSILFMNPTVRFVLLYGIIIFIITEFTRIIYQPYLSELGFIAKTEIAIFSAASLIIIAIASLVIGHLKNRNNEGYILLLISASLCLPFFFLKFHTLGIPAFIILYSAIGASGIILSDIINRIIPSESRATILSAENQLGSISYSIAAIFIGTIIDQFGIAKSASIIGIIALILFLLLFSKKSIQDLLL